MASSSSTLAGVGKGFAMISVVLEMIKFQHTIFALPFAYAGAWLASGGMPGKFHFTFITLAMIGARSTAMAFNRLIDLEIDRLNPRTADRALPKGRVSPKFVWTFICASSALFLTSAWILSPVCLLLAPIAGVILTGYSYTKRFTWLCHLWLGIALAIAPSAAWIAVRGSLDLLPVILSFAVAFWSAGFDIIYACLDVEFDRQNGIYSIPAKFGVERGLWISRFLYVLSVVCFLAAGIVSELSPAYFAGILVIACLLAYEHIVVKPDDLSKVDLAFSTLNGFVSIIFFISILIHFM